MKTENVYLTGVHRYSFRAGEPAKIIGIKMCTPEGLEPRLAYHIQYEDLLEDYIAVQDADNCALNTLLQLLNHGAPQVVN